MVEGATHCIDLHCWQSIRAATVLPRLDNETSMAMAEATAIRFVRASPGRPGAPGPAYPCTLGSYFNDSGRAAIAIELSGQCEVSEGEAALGLRAVRNCLRFLGLLSGEPEGMGEGQVRVDLSEEVNVRAPCSGVFVKQPAMALGEAVEEAALLGHVLRDDTLETVEVSAPVAGHLFGYGCIHEDRKGDEHQTRYFHPYVNEGEVVATVIVPAAQ